MEQQIELAVKNASGEPVGTRVLQPKIFGSKVFPSLLHQVVRWQRAKRRAGTHSTLTRAEASGGGVKPWRQKGTGRARAGSNTSPLWVGGGIAHGPKPRNYEFRLNKEERKRALCGALTIRRGEGKLILLDDFKLSEIRTKAAVGILEALGIEKHKSALVVLPEQNFNISLMSLRNIPRVKVLKAEGVNVYDVLNSKYVVVVGDALEKIEERLG